MQVLGIYAEGMGKLNSWLKARSVVSEQMAFVNKVV